MDFAQFHPPDITIKIGDTVTWTNDETLFGIPHTTTADNGEKYSHTFKTAGTYHYRCLPNPFMTGNVIVEN
ncbi:hypothetical protein DFQ26_002477 [Actinomortierella ambigua]|nr:hypothetical protein DFQ26_002477 [Actinomortierella ambigua]